MSPEQQQELNEARLRAFKETPTLRDQFAMAALTGILSNNGHANQIHNIDEGVSIACMYADAMLAEREKVQS